MPYVSAEIFINNKPLKGDPGPLGPPLNPPLQHNFISIVTRLQARVFIRKVNETAILMTSQLWRIRDPPLLSQSFFGGPFYANFKT